MGIDNVNHPKHYNSHPSGIEVIEITRHMNFDLGNAVKYILRADHKLDAIEDLEKAIWYIKDEIKTRKDKISEENMAAASVTQEEFNALMGKENV